MTLRAGRPVPYAFLLKAFFIPAMVSAKSTCWFAMVATPGDEPVGLGDDVCFS